MFDDTNRSEPTITVTSLDTKFLQNDKFNDPAFLLLVAMVSGQREIELLALKFRDKAIQF